MHDEQSREVPLAGGNVGGAVRIGETVRRPAGYWTGAVHDLLDYLGRAGLDGIPEPLGVDGNGREVLSYLPGRSVDVDTETVSDALLVDAVRWLRRFHDAVQSYRPAGPVHWRNGTHSLRDDQIVCHHDPGAYNWIVAGDRLVGVIDWDMAGPGRPLDDLAFMAWTAVPLFRPRPAAGVARRLRLMAEVYGGIEPVALLGHVETRMASATDRIEAGQRRGDPGMLNLASVGEPARTRASIADLRGRRPAIKAALYSV